VSPRWWLPTILTLRHFIDWLLLTTDDPIVVDDVVPIPVLFDHDWHCCYDLWVCSDDEWSMVLLLPIYSIRALRRLIYDLLIFVVFIHSLFIYTLFVIVSHCLIKLFSICWLTLFHWSIYSIVSLCYLTPFVGSIWCHLFWYSTFNRVHYIDCCWFILSITTGVVTIVDLVLFIHWFLIGVVGDDYICSLLRWWFVVDESHDYLEVIWFTIDLLWLLFRFWFVYLIWSHWYIHTFVWLLTTLIHNPSMIHFILICDSRYSISTHIYDCWWLTQWYICW